MMEQMSADNKNTAETWESYSHDEWEKNRGRAQTRLFARYFLETVRLPVEHGTVLDVGCAMGDAAPEFHERYPDLKFTGCDVSDNAIQRAKDDYGNIASFEKWSFSEIRGHYDIIYCSNTLEHFENSLTIAESLLTRCRWLYILVPYLELRDGKRLQTDKSEWHVATFDERSFESLHLAGKARRIRYWLHPCPIAWGPRPTPWLRRVARAVRDRLMGRARQPRLMEIFFEIESAWLK